MFPNTTEKNYTCKSRASNVTNSTKNMFQINFKNPISMPGNDCVLQVVESTV